MTCMKQPHKITIICNLTLQLEIGTSRSSNSASWNKTAPVNTNKLERKNFLKILCFSRWTHWALCQVQMQNILVLGLKKGSANNNYIASHTAVHITGGMRLLLLSVDATTITVYKQIASSFSYFWTSSFLLALIWLLGLWSWLSIQSFIEKSMTKCITTSNFLPQFY